MCNTGNACGSICNPILLSDDYGMVLLYTLWTSTFPSFLLLCAFDSRPLHKISGFLLRRLRPSSFRVPSITPCRSERKKRIRAAHPTYDISTVAYWVLSSNCDARPLWPNMPPMLGRRVRFKYLALCTVDLTKTATAADPANIPA